MEYSKLLAVKKDKSLELNHSPSRFHAAVFRLWETCSIERIALALETSEDVIAKMNMNNENTEARTAWAEYYIATATSFRIRCVWWDNNLVKGTGERFGLIDRQSLEAPYPEVLEALFKGLNS